MEKLNNLTKKLGDFTVREVQQICGSCSNCILCPFYGTGYASTVCIFREDDLGDVADFELEQEIPLGPFRF